MKLLLGVDWAEGEPAELERFFDCEEIDLGVPSGEELFAGLATGEEVHLVTEHFPDRLEVVGRPRFGDHDRDHRCARLIGLHAAGRHRYPDWLAVLGIVGFEFDGFCHGGRDCHGVEGAPGGEFVSMDQELVWVLVQRQAQDASDRAFFV